ncbi:NADH-quinone oxidoreductase subunit A [Peredibacter starrii]|uniref:NADH-quinone oxidoreductase subunit n=1 Tax=Peredibacter starrii TaxID=28202 RepID=A0AAX4HQD5_9BACT|nr:NADH-quinone oxidoreductase subunit A [Peredibacter starrii]WPU65417.1 NADH-quinone oxidoreductase subunit A [Peredibacter starrii]
MTPAQFDGLMPIVILMGIAVLLFVGGHFASVLLAPKKPSHLKSMPYECGEEPVGSAWSMFNVRFYVVGLIFIIFDVESVLMFPVVTIYREMMERGDGFYILDVLLSFIAILVMGIAYCWKKGDLDWVKSFQVSVKNNK